MNANDILFTDADIRRVLGGWGAEALMQSWEGEHLTGDIRDLDAQALASVYDHYAEAVYKYVRYRLYDDGLAEDVTGEVFLSLLEAIREGRAPRTNVKAWLMATAGHIVTDHIRRSYRRPTETIRDEHPDSAPSPSDELDRREQSRSFREAYRRLTAQQQHVLALRFGEGLSLEETADAIKKNVNAVKALQFRAMQAMQRTIGETRNE